MPNQNLSESVSVAETRIDHLIERIRNLDTLHAESRNRTDRLEQELTVLRVEYRTRLNIYAGFIGVGVALLGIFLKFFVK